MQHLTAEDLARLVEEVPTPAEELHLELCDHCRSELAAMREQTRALASLPDRSAPADLWPALESRLRAEGLVARRAASGPAWRSWLLRAAAALALFAGGGATGALLWDGSAGGAAPLASAAGTPEEAARAVRAAESEYLDALTRYAELTGAGEATDPVNRLAALEGIVLTTRAALEQSPADPVINGYLLTALSQREAMLRQISDPPADEPEADETWF